MPNPDIQNVHRAIAQVESIPDPVERIQGYLTLLVRWPMFEVVLRERLATCQLAIGLIAQAEDNARRVIDLSPTEWERLPEPLRAVTWDRLPPALLLRHGYADRELLVGQEVGELRLLRLASRAGDCTLFDAQGPASSRHTVRGIVGLPPDELRRHYLRHCELWPAGARGLATVEKVVEHGAFGPFEALRPIPGRLLGDLYAARRPMFSMAVEAMRLLAVALATLHERGVVHSALGPEQVAFDDLAAAPVLTLLPWACSVTGTDRLPRGAVRAPEVSGGRLGDERSDVFGLGLLAGFMLTGRAGSAEHLESQLPAEWHLQPDLQPVLQEILALVADCCALSPTTRPTAADIAERVASLQPPPRKPPPPEPQAPEPRAPASHPVERRAAPVPLRRQPRKITRLS